MKQSFTLTEANEVGKKKGRVLEFEVCGVNTVRLQSTTQPNANVAIQSVVGERECFV